MRSHALPSAFTVVNAAILGLVSLLCLFPMIHIAAVSLSSNTAVATGLVGIWPVQFSTESYRYVMGRAEFWRAMLVSVERIAIGSPLSVFLSLIIAYPLSKNVWRFRWRTVYVWIFFLTMLFSGGLIPWYMTIKELRLLDSIFALVLPGAVQVFNIVLLINFFRQLPAELEEAAIMDGAGHWRILWTLFVPVSAPVVATVTLLTVVNHWNSWFDGLILMNHPRNYPLQSYLQTILFQMDFRSTGMSDWQLFRQVSERTIKSAQIFIGLLPIVLVYPYLQRYFIKGIIIGSVKG